MDSIFAAQNFKTFPSSSLITDCNCSGSLEEYNIFVSSAKILKVNSLEDLGKSLKQIKTNLDGENRLNQDPLVHSLFLMVKFHIRFTSKSISQVGAAKTDYVRDQPPVALIVAGKVSELNFFEYLNYCQTSEGDLFVLYSSA